MSEAGKIVEVNVLIITPLGWAGGYYNGKLVAVKNAQVGHRYKVKITECRGNVCVGEALEKIA